MNSSPPPRGDLHQLTDAIQGLVRDELPVALAVAGLPYEIAELLDLPGTTFLRRAMPIQLDPLPDEEVARTLEATAATGGRHFTPEALSRAIETCAGYAYLIQGVGSISWAITEGKAIERGDVDKVLPLVRERIGLQLHQPALRGLPEREREYLEVMVSLGTPTSTGRIAELMAIPANQQSTYRRRLIERGLLRAAGYGNVDFGLPYLEEHLRRQG